MAKRSCKIIGLFGLFIIIISCNTSNSPVQIPKDTNLIWMRINDDVVATNDTVLWVQVTGQDIEMMKISEDENFADLPWITFDSLTIINAPHIEGVFTVYTIFRFANGIVSDLITDDIVLDFTVNISQVNVMTEVDTLRPGNQIEFSMISGELGQASIKFGSLFLVLPLLPEGEGLFRGVLFIPPIVKHEDASVTAIFKDIAGNETAKIVPETYPIRGPELSPTVIGRIDLNGAVCNDIWFHRGYCFISTNDIVHIINVRNEASPEYENHIQTDLYNEGIGGNNELLLVTDFTYGVSVYSLQNPDNPDRMGRTKVWGNAKDVDINNEIAYVSSEQSGLFLINLQTPANPNRIIRLPLNTTGESLCINDSLVYVAGSRGIGIVSVADPLHPYIVSQFNNIDHDVLEIVYHDGNLLLATEYGGLIRINVEDPRNPYFVKAFDHLENCSDLVIESSFLIVSQDEKISIVNLANIDELPILDEVTDLDFPQAIYAQGGMVYVAEANSLAVIKLVLAE